MTARSDHAGALEQQVRALLQGFGREFPSSSEPVLFGGRPMTFAEVQAALQAMVETFDAVHGAERALRQAIANRRQAMRGFRSTYGDAVLFLKHHLGKDSPRLLLFGIRPPKQREPLSAEAKVIAKAKAEATRRARGTKGSRQRLELGRPPEPTLRVFDADGRRLDIEGSGPASEEPAPSDPEPGGTE